MFKYLFSLMLLVCLAPLAAQSSFQFNPGCGAAETTLVSFPNLYGEVMIDGLDAMDGDTIGIFNSSDELLGRGAVFTQSGSGRTFKAFLVGVNVDQQGAGCPVFVDGDVLTVRLQNAPTAVLLAGNSTFSATEGINSILDGPDGITEEIDTFDFLASALPVTLANFSATPNRNAVDLSWSTSSETENSYFEVQRSTSSTGGFQNIGKVLGNETTTEFNTYEFTDNNPAEGTNYYRLQQFDLNGTNDFSPIVVADIAVSAERSVSVYPNPTVAGGRMTVRLNGNWTTGGANLQLVDANGRKVANWNGLSNGSLNTELPVLKAGIYQLIATDGKERQATRLIVR